MKLLTWNLALALAWCAMVGRLTVAELALGFGVGLVMLAWLDVDGKGRRYALRIPIVIGFVGFYLVDVSRSALRLAWDVITPRPRRRPAIVEIPLELETETEIAVLANIVTFTPGTLAIDIDTERKTLTIHSMFLEDRDSIRREIATFERWVVRILR